MKTATLTLCFFLTWQSAMSAKSFNYCTKKQYVLNTKTYPVSVETKSNNMRSFLARITVYWQEGRGTDRWTRRGLTCTGSRLKEGMCAVDPSVIPLGTRIHVPGLGKLLAADTGSAVINRTAALRCGKNVPVIDVFFNEKEDALEWARNHPIFVKVSL